MINPKKFLIAAKEHFENPHMGCCTVLSGFSRTPTEESIFFSNLFQPEVSNNLFWWDVPYLDTGKVREDDLARQIALLLAYEISKDEYARK